MTATLVDVFIVYTTPAFRSSHSRWRKGRATPGTLLRCPDDEDEDGDEDGDVPVDASDDLTNQPGTDVIRGIADNSGPSAGSGNSPDATETETDSGRNSDGTDRTTAPRRGSRRGQ